MKKELNEKAKKPVLIVTLCIIGMAALIGIACSLHKEEIPEKVAASGMPQAEEDVIAEWVAQEDEAAAPNMTEQEFRRTQDWNRKTRQILSRRIRRSPANHRQKLRNNRSKSL